MDTHSLSKAQKKICRELMDVALQRECSKFIESLSKTIVKNKTEKKTAHESYLDIFKRVQNFDKKLQRNFDGITGSWYFQTILSFYVQGMLRDEDIEYMDDEMRTHLIALSRTF